MVVKEREGMQRHKVLKCSKAGKARHARQQRFYAAGEMVVEKSFAEVFTPYASAGAAARAAARRPPARLQRKCVIGMPPLPTP